MTLTASNIQHLFLALLALSVVAECALTVLQTLAAEKTAGKVPARFVGYISEAGSYKAAKYTVELAQGRLLLAFAGASAALLMTYGNGLTFAASFMGAVSSSALVGEWGVLAFTGLVLCIIEFPLGWYLSCRIPLRYGYFTQSEGQWLKRAFKETVIGWFASLPLFALAIVFLELAGGHWWLLAWIFFTTYLIWRWIVNPNWLVLWQLHSKPMENPALERMVAAYLAGQGFELRKLLIAPKPSHWRHSHVLISGFVKKRTVVIFTHAAAKLDALELLTLIAHDVGHIRHAHAWLRVLIYSAVTFGLFGLAGWASYSDAFFKGLGFSPYVTLVREGSHAGFVLAVALVGLPVLFYFVRPVVNLFTRLLQYDADRYALTSIRSTFRTGGDALVDALVKLHGNYTETLTPSRLYSLFHYSRPHAGMRIEALEIAAEKCNLHLVPHAGNEEEEAKNAREQSQRGALLSAFDATPYLAAIAAAEMAAAVTAQTSEDPNEFDTEENLNETAEELEAALEETFEASIYESDDKLEGAAETESDNEPMLPKNPNSEDEASSEEEPETLETVEKAEPANEDKKSPETEEAPAKDAAATA